MDGRDFIAVAHRLSQEQTEADWRTAAGRAYYGLLQESRAFLESWGFIPRGREDIHKFVRFKLIYAADANLKDIGFALEHLARLRNEADYHLQKPGQFGLPTSALVAARKAESSVAALDQINNDPTRRAAAIASIPV